MPICDHTVLKFNFLSKQVIRLSVISMSLQSATSDRCNDFLEVFDGLSHVRKIYCFKLYTQCKLRTIIWFAALFISCLKIEHFLLRVSGGLFYPMKTFVINGCKGTKQRK